MDYIGIIKDVPVVVETPVEPKNSVMERYKAYLEQIKNKNVEE